MDKSETAVKSLYFRTLAALRKDLSPQLGAAATTRSSKR